LLAPHLGRVDHRDAAPSLNCVSQVPDNSKGFQMFRR